MAQRREVRVISLASGIGASAGEQKEEVVASRALDGADVCVQIALAPEVDEVVSSAERAARVHGAEGSFEQRRERLGRRLSESRTVTKMDLLQRNIMRGGASVVRRNSQLLGGLLERRPKLEDLIQRRWLEPDYLDQAFPASAARDAEHAIKQVSLHQLLEQSGSALSTAATFSSVRPSSQAAQALAAAATGPVDPAVVAAMMRAAMLSSGGPWTAVRPGLLRPGLQPVGAPLPMPPLGSMPASVVSSVAPLSATMAIPAMERSPATVPTSLPALATAAILPSRPVAPTGCQAAALSAAEAGVAQVPGLVSTTLPLQLLKQQQVPQQQRPPKPSVLAQRGCRAQLAPRSIPAGPLRRDERAPFVRILDSFCDRVLGKRHAEARWDPDAKPDATPGAAPAPFAPAPFELGFETSLRASSPPPASAGSTQGASARGWLEELPAPAGSTLGGAARDWQEERAL